MLEDERRHIELVNQAFCDLFRIPAPPGTLLGMDCSSAAEQSKALFADPERFVQRVTDILAAGIAVDGELIEMADGTVVERDYVPIVIDGERRGHLWKYRNVTERVRATRWRQMLLDSMMEGVIVVNKADGLILFANPTAERLFRFGAGQLIGHHIRTLVSERYADDPDFFTHAYAQAISATTEWPARRHDGSEFTIELQLTEFDAGDGGCFVGFIRDMSERQAVDQLKREFISTVSHELRTPLTSIRASLGLLDGGVAGQLSPDARELVGVANRSVVRLIGLINDILDLDRADGPVGLSLTRQAVPLDPIIQRATDAVGPLASEYGVTLETTPGQLVVLADATRVEQVVVNLLSNAVKFSPRGGTVSIQSRVRRGMTMIEVADRGPGVPPAFRSVIFEPFRQVTSADNRERGGSGLGLTISRAIVRQHGGTIGVEDRDGGGSIFWFTLPPASDPTP